MNAEQNQLKNLWLQKFTKIKKKGKKPYDVEERLTYDSVRIYSINSYFKIGTNSRSNFGIKFRRIGKVCM